jgi:hypothetical protein
MSQRTYPKPGPLRVETLLGNPVLRVVHFVADVASEVLLTAMRQLGF